MAFDQDPMNVLSKLSEAYQGVKFGSGVVGKTSYLTIGIISLWFMVVWRISSDWIMNLFLFVSALIASGLYIWWVLRTQKYARENPGLAMLEGAQFIEYQKWAAGIKDVGEVTGVLIVDPKLKIEDK